jgi:hypothetical protein
VKPKYYLCAESSVLFECLILSALLPISDFSCVFLNSCFQRFLVRSNNLLNLLALLEEQEGGHGTDAEFLCDVVDLINVNLVEAGVFKLLGHLGYLGRNDFARTAPGSEAVENDKGISRVSEGLLEVRFAIKEATIRTAQGIIENIGAVPFQIMNPGVGHCVSVAEV